MCNNIMALAGLQIFEVVKFGEILRIYLWMLWVKCGYATNERMPIA